MTTRIRGAREGSVLSSQLGRGGYKEGRHDDFDFDQVFDNGNVDDPAMFGGQMDDFQYDGFADGTGGAFESMYIYAY